MIDLVRSYGNADTFTAKHFVNDPHDLVLSALRSVTLTNPATALDIPNKIIYRQSSTIKLPQVSLVSGGGSGHEPAFTAFVGHGLLTASVAGTIFASPSAKQVRRAIMQSVESSKGVLVIVMNYTGDVLNFGLAVESARANGRLVEMVVVGDDVGVGRRQAGKVGRRGIAGTVLVHKITGALAATGADFRNVVRVAKLVADNIVSIGCSLSHVHVPGHERIPEQLGIDELEIGMGIHNEPGAETANLDLPVVIRSLLDHLLDQTDDDRAFLDISASDDVVLLINNLGGTSVIEMGAITTETVLQLDKHFQVKPVRIISGTFMTSLNGLGFSLTLLRLREIGMEGTSMLHLLDAPAEVTGWTAPVNAQSWAVKDKARGSPQVELQPEEIKDSSEERALEINWNQAEKALSLAMKAVIAEEPSITHYDTVVGDGDCGVGLRRGANAVLELLEKETNDAIVLVSRIASAVETAMDGTSGALYAIFLNALVAELRRWHGKSNQATKIEIWAEALSSSLETLGNYTPAQPGDRTLIDALQPFIATLRETGDLGEAARAAEEGAKKTKGMTASLGRSVYVGGDRVQQVPDPGAFGLSVILVNLCNSLSG